MHDGGPTDQSGGAAHVRAAAERELAWAVAEAGAEGRPSGGGGPSSAIIKRPASAADGARCAVRRVAVRGGEWEGGGGGMRRRLEAFCMGLHWRLGEGSRVAQLDPALVDALLRDHVAPHRCVVLY